MPPLQDAIVDGECFLINASYECGVHTAGIVAYLKLTIFLKGGHGQIDEQVIHGCGVGDGFILAAEYLG